MNNKLIRKSEENNYQIQIFDLPVVTRPERLAKQISFRVRVTGRPMDPNQIIPAILPKIQNYINNQYSLYNPDPISWDNFDIENAKISEHFSNTIDFWVTISLS